MSEFVKINYPNPTRTIFENTWDLGEDNPNLLFRSEQHGIMALADIYPRLYPQVVVAPKGGKKGEVVHVHDLPSVLRLRLHHVADTVAAKMQAYVDEQGIDKYVITHTEGRSIKDHAHIVVAGGKEKEGVALYTGTSLGKDVVKRTVDALFFDDDEAARLNYELARISVW